jgi:hypothetical protein
MATVYRFSEKGIPYSIQKIKVDKKKMLFQVEIQLPNWLHEAVRRNYENKIQNFNSYDKAKMHAISEINTILEKQNLFEQHYFCEKCLIYHRGGKIYHEHLPFSKW